MSSNYLYKFDRVIARMIPNFNVRAILYVSLIFALALYVEIWRISPSREANNVATQKTMDEALQYWNNSGYESSPQEQKIHE
jgi:hypothetical protein